MYATAIAPAYTPTTTSLSIFIEPVFQVTV